MVIAGGASRNGLKRALRIFKWFGWRVLVQLRNFKNKFDKAMESISTFFKDENDILFRRGYRKGFKEGYRQGLEEARNV